MSPKSEQREISVHVFLLYSVVDESDLKCCNMGKDMLVSLDLPFLSTI